MARKGQKKGLKRTKAPKTWRIKRKVEMWTTNPHCGPHNKAAIPLVFVLRDMLGYAMSAREARRILSERKISVNGRTRHDIRYPVGIMDVVEIANTGEAFRMLVDKKGSLMLHPIEGEEKKIRIAKILDKHIMPRNRTQLALHDGSTLSSEQKVSTSDSLLISERKIVGHLPFTKGNIGLVVKGDNVGRVGKIVDIKNYGIYQDIVVLEDHERFETLADYVIVIGDTEPRISMPKVIV